MQTDMPSFLTRHKVMYRRALLSISVLALLGVLVPVIPAHAVTCNTVNNCKDGSTTAKDNANDAVGDSISSYSDLVEYDVDVLLDILTRAANNDSQNSSARSTAALQTIDNEGAAATAAQLGVQRANLAMAYVPSKSTCSILSRNMRVTRAAYSPARIAQIETTQRNVADYASNAPTGPTGRGSLQAFSSNFKEINNGFCDPAVMFPAGVPSGMTCTVVNDSDGKSMAWRYTQPYDAIFNRDAIPSSSTNPENRAARLYSQIAFEPVPPDPIRGPMLSRTEGRNAFMLRQRDIAAMSLARGVIDRMVDDRLWDGTAANPSLQQLRMKAWNDAQAAYDDAMERVQQGEETNVRDLPVIVKDINALYLEIYKSLERVAALKATRISRTIQSNQGVGGANASALSLQRD